MQSAFKIFTILAILNVNLKLLSFYDFTLPGYYKA